VKPGDLQALLAVPPERVLEVQSRLSGELAMSRDRERFGDAVGSPILLQPTFDTDVLPRCPIAAIAQGAAAGIDLLVGTTTEEAKIFMVEMKGLFNEPVVEALLDRVMRPAGRSGRDVLSLYQQNRPGALPFELAAAAETDRLFRIPALRLADAQAAHHPGTWMYEFAWRSTARGGEFGACHFLEVPFMFDQLDNEQARGIAGTPPQELADKLHPAWVAFAKTGDPHHAALPAWPRWDSERRPALRFDIRCEVVCDTASEERKVWDGVL